MADRHGMAVEGAEVALDLSVGHIAALAFEAGGRRIEPLHRAPWADDPEEAFAEGVPAVERRLSGDFLCAPFGADDVEDAPPHGWPANARWDLIDERSEGPEVWATFRLSRLVRGASVEKTLRLRAGEPVLYQAHRLVGGKGAVPVAHHAMTRMARGGRIDVSPKRHAETPEATLWPEPRPSLAYPARSTDLGAFPDAHGGKQDLRVYPAETGAEDFVTLVEAESSPLGWTVVAREAEDDLVIVLKDPRELPVTMLWRSNGGRDATPWSGRHAGVLGIEDGRAWGLAGHAASGADNPLRREDVPTALELSPLGVREIHHAIAVVPCPPGWGRTEEVTVLADRLVLSGAARLELPFDGAFLGAHA